jgi:hypothetical protein
MNKTYFIITYPESGWDCVRGLYLAENEEEVWKVFAEGRAQTIEKLKEKYIIHSQNLVEV